MLRSDARILTTHTGSLPRPAGLVSMLGSVSRGEAVDQPALDAAAQQAISDVVSAQLAAGVDVINNGEQSRVSFSTYVTQRMSGFGGAWTRRGHRDQNESPSIRRSRVVQLMSDVPTCVGPLSYDCLDLVEQECQQLLATVDSSYAKPQELFMTAASPGIVALTMANRYYGNHEEYVFALAGELRKEYEIIVRNGLTLQLDCPDLAMERHVSYQDEPLSAFRDVVALHVRAINYALSDIPRDRVRLHVCWGNSEGPHHYDVPLEDILDLLYDAKVGALVMEMANPRHAHEHRVYRDVPLPEGMLLVAGVIDTKTNYVEHPRLVADRLHQAVAAAGGDPTRVLAGTDCGFDTSAGSNRVEPGIVWLKLQAMREGADIASRELF
ncbi:MAG: cobalamin-independent methionine synthase II family protein [Chloroflexi bacterium]|nr:cobalamin-independent methionine synthase II family protein [Chloroflexota bacterium]